MVSVREWSEARGYEYLEWADRLFLELAPPQFRAKSTEHIQPITDLARLEAAAQLLTEGADTVLWADADLLVFSPSEFRLPEVADCAFTREVWLNPPGTDRHPVLHRVNNSMSLFRAGGTFLDDYRLRCREVAERADRQLRKAEASTEYLTALLTEHPYTAPFELIHHVGNFSPWLLDRLTAGDTKVLMAYQEALGERLLAANLCSSHENRPYLGTPVRNSTEVYDQVVELLLHTEGAALSGTTR